MLLVSAAANAAKRAAIRSFRRRSCIARSSLGHLCSRFSPDPTVFPIPRQHGASRERERERERESGGMTRAVRVKECRAVISSAHRTEGIERGPAGWATGDRGHRSKRKSEKRTLNEALARREDGERKTARARERERKRESEGHGERRQKRAPLHEGSLP